jgi:hypothetical protein
VQGVEHEEGADDPGRLRRIEPAQREREVDRPRHLSAGFSLLGGHGSEPAVLPARESGHSANVPRRKPRRLREVCDGPLTRFRSMRTSRGAERSRSCEDHPLAPTGCQPLAVEGRRRNSGMIPSRDRAGIWTELALICAERLLSRCVLTSASVSKVPLCRERSADECVDRWSGYAQACRKKEGRRFTGPRLLIRKSLVRAQPGEPTPSAARGYIPCVLMSRGCAGVAPSRVQQVEVTRGWGPGV